MSKLFRGGVVADGDDNDDVAVLLEEMSLVVSVPIEKSFFFQTAIARDLLHGNPIAIFFFCKLLVIVCVVQAHPRADQPRRSRDAAAVSPTPVEWDDFTFFTTLRLSMS